MIRAGHVITPPMHNLTEERFSSFDNTEIFYRAWIPSAGSYAGADNAAPRAVVLFHRGHEHSGRLLNLVKELDIPDCTIFAWDQRGHGRSSGERGFAPHFLDLARDVDSFLHEISKRYGIELRNIIVAAHSLSAVFVTYWLKNYAPQIRGLVLITPAFKVKLYVPLALPGLKLLQSICRYFGKKTFYIKSYVKGRLLTHDQEEARAYDADPLITRQIAVNVLLELFETSSQLLNDAGAIITPLLLLSARSDWVVYNAPQRRFFNKVSSPYKVCRVFKDKYHSLFHELDRTDVIASMRGFIIDQFFRPFEPLSLKDADQSGYTCEEHQWLEAALPPISAKRLVFGLQKSAMNTIGRLSCGIAVGLNYGFDSGESLDYIYRNKPEGKNKLGELIDGVYLDAIGWRGIRIRKANLQKLIAKAINLLSTPQIRIVDLAGGPGRYLLDLVKDRPDVKFDVLIRDISDSGLEQGRAAAKMLDLSNVQYQHGSAFDIAGISAITPKADIAIVSGLYELFPSNQPVRDSLTALSSLVRPGGYLIYTNQPWHPQLEMIAETLRNRDGRPWVMRRRTQAEIDQLVAAAGFSKTAMEVDNFGIFTVSMAKRNG